MGRGTDITGRLILPEQGGRYSLDTLLDPRISVKLCIAEYQLFEGDVAPYSDLVAEYLKGGFPETSSAQVAVRLVKLAGNYASGELQRTVARFGYTDVQAPDEATVNQLYGQLVELVLHSRTKVPQHLSEPISAYAAVVLTTNPAYRRRLLADAPKKQDGKPRSCEEAIALLRWNYHREHSSGFILLQHRGYNQ